MPALDERCDPLDVLRKRMLACNEVSDRPPDTFIHRNDRWELHQVLNRRDRFAIAGMQVEVAVADGEYHPAAATDQASGTAEEMLGMIR